MREHPWGGLAAGRLDVQAGAHGAGRAEIPGAGQHAEKAQGYGKGFQQKSTVSSVEEEMAGGKVSARLSVTRRRGPEEGGNRKVGGSTARIPEPEGWG